ADRRSGEACENPSLYSDTVAAERVGAATIRSSVKRDREHRRGLGVRYFGGEVSGVVRVVHLDDANRSCRPRTVLECERNGGIRSDAGTVGGYGSSPRTVGAQNRGDSRRVAPPGRQRKITCNECSTVAERNSRALQEAAK